MMMTEKQARVARDLARYYGHEWGWVDQTEGLTDSEEIRAATVAARDFTPSVPGREGPRFLDDMVVHQTTTGRVTYAVGPEGLEEVIVTRPVPPAEYDLCADMEARVQELVPRAPAGSIRALQAERARAAIREWGWAICPMEGAVCLRWTRASGLDSPETMQATACERHWDALCCVLESAGVPLPDRPDWIQPDWTAPQSEPESETAPPLSEESHVVTE